MEDPIVPFDWARMFLGDDPNLFYLEIVFRTCLVYAYALALIRWVGGRGIAQMSTVEFLLVIALGSAVGDAMFYPEVPILHAMLVITIVVIINKCLDWLIQRYDLVEKAIDGATAEIVRDGVIVMKTLGNSSIGKSELFMSLRTHGVTNLGEVRSAYIETSGQFSVFRAEPPRAGLRFEPAWDVAPPPFYYHGDDVTALGQMCCCGCGSTLSEGAALPERCDICGGTSWTTAEDGAPEMSRS
jgi:uncharacterized membrane protein YcaP (DUF421 family)